MSSPEQEKPWWLRPMTLESLTKLRESVKESSQSGLGLAGVTMNQIQIALAELHDRMKKDQPTDPGDSP